MTQEQKAKAYDEAKARMSKAFNSNRCTIGFMNEIFPELHESKDERIRKAIITLLNTTIKGKKVYSIADTTRSEMLTWLEKQGDNPIIKWNKNTKDCKPKVNHSVLMNTTHGIAEGEWQGERWHQYRWAGLVRDTDVLSWMELSDLEKQDEKSQRMISAETKEALYNKLVWSDEDECYMSECIGAIATMVGWSFEEKAKTKHWLKSLRDRVQPQPKKEWSEEDEAALGDALWCCKQAASIAKDENDMGNTWYAEKWLKSLKQRMGG